MTAARPYLLSECTWAAVRDESYSVAVLPWGATEAHNLHLPYGTDNYECDYVAAESARVAWDRGVRVVVLPTIPFGVNTGQLDVKLCVNMNPSTQLAVLRDVIESLERHGIQKLVLLNGHGGNDFKQMIRELQPRTKVFLSVVNWWLVSDSKSYFERDGDHAGELETSVMLQAHPEFVAPLQQAGEGRARKPTITAMREGWAWSPRRWTQVTDDTGIGDPRRATAEKGGRFLHDTCAKIADFLEELAWADVDRLYE